jgi:hypothetical protein
MKNSTAFFGLLKPLLMSGLLLLASICQTTAASAAHEVTVPVLRVGTNYFTNATVTAQSATHVMVNYSGGMTMTKMGDLDPEVQRQLGFGPKSAKGPNASGTNATLFGKLNQMANDFVAGMKQALADREAEEMGQPRQRGPYHYENPTWIEKVIGLSIAAEVVFLYLPFCNACRHLCRRAGAPAGILVWLPGWKRFPLFRAVGVSWWWIFLAPGIGWIIFSVRLCEVFQLSRWWAWLLLIPLINWFVFIYFARATKSEDHDPAIALRQGYAA